MTESTEISILLNSSKHPQAPHWHKPENSFPTACHIGRKEGVEEKREKGDEKGR